MPPPNYYCNTPSFINCINCTLELKSLSQQNIKEIGPYIHQAGVTKMMQEAENNYWKEQFNAAAISANFWNVVKKLKRKQKQRKIGPLKNDKGSLITDDRE